LIFLLSVNRSQPLSGARDYVDAMMAPPSSDRSCLSVWIRDKGQNCFLFGTRLVSDKQRVL
jgi:hypothetical protein